MKKLKLQEGTFTGEVLSTQVLDGYILSMTKHNQNMEVPKHEHEHPYLSLLLHGFYNEESIITEQNFIPGTSLFRPSNYEHKNEIGPKQGLCFNLEIKKDIFKDNLKNSDDSFIRFEHNNLEVMKMYLNYKRNFSKELLNLTVDENAYLLFSRGKISNRTEHTQWVHNIKKQVRFNPERKYAIDQVANTLHMHPVYFVRKFKELAGYTFGEFLIRQRLSKAIDLMPCSNKNLTTVALESGFYDQSHFIRRFKEAFNITPSNYIEITKS
jgi:AraC-like DNA-binding protein